MKTKRQNGFIQSALLVLLACAAGVVGLFFYHCGPGGSEILDQVKLPDGSEYKISQSYNGWTTGEPYTVSFYSKDPGQDWNWHYVDHEADRWRDVSITYDAASDTIIVTQRGTRRLVLDRGQRVYSIENGRDPTIVRPLELVADPRPPAP